MPLDQSQITGTTPIEEIDKDRETTVTPESETDLVTQTAPEDAVNPETVNANASATQPGPITPVLAQTAERAHGTMTSEMAETLKDVDMVCVDDEEMNRTMVKRSSEIFGAKSIKTFKCGEEFLAALDTIPQGASVLLDNTMKISKDRYGQAGTVCAKKVREAGRTDLKIYIFSGDFSGEPYDPFKIEIENLVREGIINGFFEKPESIREILKEIALKAKM